MVCIIVLAPTQEARNVTIKSPDRTNRTVLILR